MAIHAQDLINVAMGFIAIAKIFADAKVIVFGALHQITVV